MIVTIDDLRRSARRRLPKAVFDYIDGGAEEEQTLRENHAAFSRLRFRPRVLVDVGTIDQSTTLCGQPIASPLILAPTGLSGMAMARAELPAARAANKTGVLYTAATLATVQLEQIMREAPGPHWFQLYVFRDRPLTHSLVERAQAAGYRALCVTADVPVAGGRERDVRNGATIPPKITLRNAIDSALRYRWMLTQLRDPWIDFVNLHDESKSTKSGALKLPTYIGAQFDPTFNWEDLAALRRQWRGTLALKGVMSAEDACRAVDCGVEAIVLSNHGGRQLDGLPAPIEVLSEVVQAVAGRAEVILDGGVRRGADVVKAIALGARACMLGRPYLYGLAAGGQTGAELAITILQTEIARALALLGVPRLADVDRSVLRLPAGFPGWEHGDG